MSARLELQQARSCAYRKFRPLGLRVRIGHEYGVLDLFNLIKWMLLDLFRSRISLQGEVIVLRQQLNKRPTLSMFDRLIFVWSYRLVPAILDAVAIIRPETIVGWHRTGFRTGSGRFDDPNRWWGSIRRVLPRTSGYRICVRSFARMASA
jgi:hypothetical protein